MSDSPITTRRRITQNAEDVKVEEGAKPPEHLSFSGNLSENWAKWKRSFELYLSRRKLDSEKHKYELLKCHIGPKGCNTLETFSFTYKESATPYTSTLNKFDAYFKKRRNIIKELYFKGLHMLSGKRTNAFFNKIRRGSTNNLNKGLSILGRLVYSISTLPKSTLIVSLISIAILTSYQREAPCYYKGKIPRDVLEQIIYDHQVSKMDAAAITSVSMNADFGNRLIDTLIANLQNVIRKNHSDEIEIPDFDESGFKGRNGRLGSTLSVARKGNTNIRMEGATLILASKVGLNHFRLKYDYEAELAIGSGEGTITAIVQSNAISFSLAVDFTPDNCRIYLRSLYLAELGDIDVDVTGLGFILNFLGYSTIVSEISKGIEQEIRDAVNNKIKASIGEELKKVKCPL